MSEGEGDDSTTRWLISYADYMMQLVCLFILLYATSNPNEEVRKIIAQMMRERAGIHEPKQVEKSREREPPQSDIPNLEEKDYITLQKTPTPYGPKISLRSIERGREMTFENIEMFAEGKAILPNDVRDLVIFARDILSHYANDITIVGHTAKNVEDSVNGDKWLLSYQRAKVIADLFMDKNSRSYIYPDRIRVEANADFKPRKDETNPATYEEARKANRCVDIIIEGLKPRNIQPTKRQGEEEK